MVILDYRDARPIYTQIADGIREQVTAGILQSGDKLPSVRELAATLAINPNTIQRSYRQLEAEGWIVTVPGKGCFISGAREAQEQEIQRLLAVFDTTAVALEQLGIPRQALMARLEKGETHHA